MLKWAFYEVKEVKRGIAKRETRGFPFAICHVFLDLTHP